MGASTVDMTMSRSMGGSPARTKLQRLLGLAVPLLLAADAVALVGLAGGDGDTAPPTTPAVQTDAGTAATVPAIVGGGGTSARRAATRARPGAGKGATTPAKATTTRVKPPLAAKGQSKLPAVPLPITVPEAVTKALDDATRALDSTVTTLQTTVTTLQTTVTSVVSGTTGTVSSVVNGVTGGSAGTTASSLLAPVTDSLPKLPK